MDESAEERALPLRLLGSILHQNSQLRRNFNPLYYRRNPVHDYGERRGNTCPRIKVLGLELINRVPYCEEELLLRHEISVLYTHLWPIYPYNTPFIVGWPFSFAINVLLTPGLVRKIQKDRTPLVNKQSSRLSTLSKSAATLSISY